MSGIARRLMGVTKGAVDPDLVLVFDTSLGTTTISLPLNGTVDATVDWGDNTSDIYTTAGTKTHTYASGGEYTVRVSGTVTQFGSGATALSRPELTKCLSFGNIGIISLNGAFRDCANLTEVPTVLPFSTVNLQRMFLDATSFNQDIGVWDTSNIINMIGVFFGAVAFNQDIGGWDTSRVTGMDNMFNNATAFNQDLTGWCVGNLTALPNNFAGGSSGLSPTNFPVWGTCPGFEVDGNITYIGAAEGTDSATLPAHQAGDLILAFAFRSGSTVATTLPAGWTSIALAGANVTHGRLAFKIAQSSSETSGTWTNATRVIFQVYRNAEPANITLAELRSTATGSSTTVSYNAVNAWKDLAWTVAFMGHRSTDNSAGTPTGLTARSSTNSDARMLGADSTDTSDVWAAQTVNIGGTSSGWRTFVLRLRNRIKKIGT